MGLIKAFTGALGGTFADQWIDVITAGPFTEQTVVTPGVWRKVNNGRGSNCKVQKVLLLMARKYTYQRILLHLYLVNQVLKK